MTDQSAAQNDLDLQLEALPDAALASLEVRNRTWSAIADRNEGFEFIVSDLQAWTPGATIRVAFLGGDADLHKAIAGATEQITDACNLTLDFGVDPATGEHRRWTESDTEYAAEIRVSFDLGGYFSLVGTDSNDPVIDGGAVGGGPGQRSLNLGGYTQELPNRWQGTVRHEFLHALSFHHEHQNMRGPCEREFRWEDDPGYIPTTDNRGRFIPDASGRRPGIYTYLAGPPNEWPKAKVDHNLRTEDDPSAIAAIFDAASVMLYQFPAFFYESTPSPCGPTGDGVNLSEGDKRGLRVLYPHAAADLDERRSRAEAMLESMSTGPESAAAGSSPAQDRISHLLEQRATAAG